VQQHTQVLLHASFPNKHTALGGSHVFVVASGSVRKKTELIHNVASVKCSCAITMAGLLNCLF